MCLACSTNMIKSVRNEALYLLASLVVFLNTHDPTNLKLFLAQFEVEAIMLSILKDFLSDNSNQLLALETFNHLFASEHQLSDDMTEGLRYQMNFEKKGGLDSLEEL